MIEVANRNLQKPPESITPSGFWGDSKEHIVEMENFLTAEELDTLSNFARGITVWDITETHIDENGTVIYEADYWKDRVATYFTLMKQDVKIVEMLDDIARRLKPYVDKHFNVEASPTGPTIVRWLPGQFQKPHADKELHEGSDRGNPNDFPHYDLGCLFYLNDDYEGGELYFPNQGIQFKPKAGAAYFFPGDMNYIHGVTEITSGIRYTCPRFWHIRKHLGD